MPFSDLLVSPQERVFRDFDEKHDIGYYERKKQLTGAVTNSALDAARASGQAVSRTANNFHGWVQEKQQERAVEKARRQAELEAEEAAAQREAQQSFHEEYGVPKFAAFWDKKPEQEHKTVRNLAIAGGAAGVGSSVLDLASGGVRDLEVQRMAEAGHKGPAYSQDTGGRLISDPTNTRSVVSHGDLPTRARHALVSTGLHSGEYSPFGGDDAVAQRAQRLFEGGDPFNIVPEAADSHVFADATADASPTARRLSKWNRFPRGSAIALGGAGLLGAGLLTPKENHGTKAVLYGGAAAATALPTVVEGLGAAAQWRESDRLRGSIEAAGHAGLDAGRRAQVVRRFKDVAKLPLGMTMAALPAYLAYKEYQKTGAATIRDGSPFISHGGIPEMAQPGGEEIKTEQGAGDPAMGNGLDGRGRFAEGAKEGSIIDLDKLAVTGDLVSRAMVSRATRLAADPSKALARRTARQFESVQTTMGNRRSKANKALTAFEGNLPDRPGVGAHAKEKKLRKAKSTAGANSNAVDNAAHGMQGGSVHYPNIQEPLRQAKYESPVFKKKSSIRAQLIKTARNWTPAQRKHYFKTLKESGKYKTKKQYEEDKKKNYKAKEVQRPGTSERPAKPRQKVGG